MKVDFFRYFLIFEIFMTHTECLSLHSVIFLIVFALILPEDLKGDSYFLLLM